MSKYVRCVYDNEDGSGDYVGIVNDGNDKVFITYESCKGSEGVRVHLQGLLKALGEMYDFTTIMNTDLPQVTKRKDVLSADGETFLISPGDEQKDIEELEQLIKIHQAMIHLLKQEQEQKEVRIQTLQETIEAYTGYSISDELVQQIIDENIEDDTLPDKLWTFDLEDLVKIFVGKTITNIDTEECVIALSDGTEASMWGDWECCSHSEVKVTDQNIPNATVTHVSAVGTVYYLWEGADLITQICVTKYLDEDETPELATLGPHLQMRETK